MASLAEEGKPSNSELRKPGNSDYLMKVLGDALPVALSEIVHLRPSDPIEFLALWLRQHAARLALQQEEREEAKALEREKTEVEMEIKRQQELRQEALHMRSEEERRKLLFLRRSQEIDEIYRKEEERLRLEEEERVRKEEEERIKREEMKSKAEDGIPADEDGLPEKEYIIREEDVNGRNSVERDGMNQEVTTEVSNDETHDDLGIHEKVNQIQSNATTAQGDEILPPVSINAETDGVEHPKNLQFDRTKADGTNKHTENMTARDDGSATKESEKFNVADETEIAKSDHVAYVNATGSGDDQPSGHSERRGGPEDGMADFSEDAEIVIDLDNSEGDSESEELNLPTLKDDPGLYPIPE